MPRSTPRSRFRPFLFAAVATLAPSLAAAQSLNRALWLGSEEEGLRRNYAQDAEYFIDRASIVDAPPWWRADSLDPFGSRASVAGGSVSSDDLTFENSIQIAQDLGKGTSFLAQQLASENQTTRYQRFGAGFGVETSDATSFLFMLEGEADKERADVSFGAEFARTESAAHRFFLTLVDWSDGKSDVFAYDSKGYGLMFTGYEGDPDGVQFTYDISTQLPFEERTFATGDVFEMTRTIGLAELRIPVGRRDRIVLSFDGELTDKENRTSDPTSARREDADVARGRVRADWWRSPDDGRDTSLGVWAHSLDEDYVRPNAPSATRRVRRREAGVAARARMPLNESWTVEPYLIAGYVDLEDAVGGIDEDLDFGSFQGRIGAPLLFRFSGTAFLRIDLSMQLDQFAFGGAAVQLQAIF